MFLRVECHRKRGKAQDLYVNNVARALEKVDAHVKAHDMEKRANARHVNNDIKINTATVVLRTQGTGMSRDDVHSQVDSYLDKQATSWIPSLKDARTIMDYASAALPLVGGVVRCAPTFGGFLPVDTPDEVIDLVTGAAKHVSDGYSGDEEIASQARGVLQKAEEGIPAFGRVQVGAQCAPPRQKQRWIRFFLALLTCFPRWPSPRRRKLAAST